MNATDLRVMEQFAARVRRIEPDARIWAFGSRVRGDADELSDLDVCVVLPSLTVDVRKAISQVAWETGFEHGILITSVVFSDEQFDRGPMSASPLVRSIRRDGLAA